MTLSEADALPFRRWLSTLKKHSARRTKDTFTDPLPDVSEDCTAGPSNRRQALSETSSDLLAEVKSGSMTATNLSFTHAGSEGYQQRRFSRHKRSEDDGRGSSDSSAPQRAPLMDHIARSRASRRRKIIEELIESEETYIADLKILVNVFVTLLASISIGTSHIRASICENITQILYLHEGLLDQLHQVVPNIRQSGKEVKQVYQSRPFGHVRWHSADNAMERLRRPRTSKSMRRSLEYPRKVDEYAPHLFADPQTAASVAGVFDENMGNFLVYEDYSAKYETMIKDIAATYKDLPAKEAFEKGIEVLSRTLASLNHREGQEQKGLTLGDLFIKPIQRICKYPLLFADLCKTTPVADGPECHAEIEKVLMRLKETARATNQATGDPKARDVIEKTWLLQDRLIFDFPTSHAIASRMLGHVILCGVLYVAYQGPDSVNGSYMLCAMFKAYLVLAVADKAMATFSVVACIPLVSIGVEDADNGRGLQCHTAPHSWKLVFDMDNCLYEIIMSACSGKEEEEWRRHCEQRIAAERQRHEAETENLGARDILSSLTLNIKPVGQIFGQAQTLTRSISIRRALTLNPKPQMSQVVIKNTLPRKQPQNSIQPTSGAAGSNNSLIVGRSQSLLSSAVNIPTLAPRRSERSHLEHALSDVWTKDKLPFPGMSPRYNENVLRASATSMIRKLSMVNLAANRRTLQKEMAFSKSGTANSNSKIPKVNFQNSPDQFLPPDFEPESLRLKSRKKSWWLKSSTTSGAE